jgi:Uma2 family endonuclease
VTQQDRIAKAAATYDDVLAAPPHMVAELIDGALSLQPRPPSRHAHASAILTGKIGSRFHEGDDGPGGWWILAEPELHLGSHVLVPDLAGWRRERMPVFPDASAFDLAPNWVCKILSPSTRARDLIEKRPLYAEHGVGHLWLVDPTARLLEAFRLGPDGWIVLSTVEDGDDVALPPLEAAPFAIDALWPPASG